MERFDEYFNILTTQIEEITDTVCRLEMEKKRQQSSLSHLMFGHSRNGMNYFQLSDTITQQRELLQHLIETRARAGEEAYIEAEKLREHYYQVAFVKAARQDCKRTKLHIENQQTGSDKKSSRQNIISRIFRRLH